MRLDFFYILKVKNHSLQCLNYIPNGCLPSSLLILCWLKLKAFSLKRMTYLVQI